MGDRKLLWECDANGFCEIGIKIEGTCSSFVMKCGLCVVYKKDIEDLNQTMAKCTLQKNRPVPAFFSQRFYKPP